MTETKDHTSGGEGRGVMDILEKLSIHRYCGSGITNITKGIMDEAIDTIQSLHAKLAEMQRVLDGIDAGHKQRIAEMEEGLNKIPHNCVSHKCLPCGGCEANEILTPGKGEADEH